MARYCGPVCRLCRREGEKLFLKGERCYTDKCAVERRETPPGQHGRGRQQFSNYKVQLREKQKAKRMFRVLERSFRGYFERAYRRKGVTGTQLLQSLETRLDSIVYRLGFGFSRAHARQLVTHGHVLVNGKSVDIASYQVKIGDTVEIKEASKQDVAITSALQTATARPVPAWMNLDREKLRGTINALPTREQLPQNIKEQLIVELYSR